MSKKYKEKTCVHKQHAIRGIGLINVIWSKPTTIVILPNGVKGISRCLPGDVFSSQVGFFLAFADAYEKSHCSCKEEDVINFVVP